jgi:hypothetical protein
VSGESGYRFEAVFKNSSGEATSHVTTLTVTPAPSGPVIPVPSSPVVIPVPSDPGVTAPVITTQPGPDTVAAGQTASFSAAASGSPTPSVQWEESTDGATWAPISGATSTTYSFAAPVGDSGFEFAAVFSNAGGSVTSSPATLTVTPLTAAPAIVANPTSTSVAVGQTASFSASASGSPAPTVQWEESTNGATWSPISGATSTTYSLVATSPENGYRFEAAFTNAIGTATTSAVTLTVMAVAPSVTTQPSADTVPAGQVASFSAAASGSPAPTVQWQESTNGATWSPISGATATTYSLVATSPENGYAFRAVFTNAGGSATSSAAALTVEVGSDAAAENWSGYADTGATFTSIGSSWTVPTVTCPAMASDSAAEWIGIDGYAGSDATVEQDGTSSDCVSGTPTYDAWFEMYGDSSEYGGDEAELNPSIYPVSAGDDITASVSVSNNNWTLALEDSSGWSFSTVVNFDAAQSSAEWIVERPETCNGNDCALTSLAQFSTVTFTNAQAFATSGSGSISSYPFWDIEMVNNAGTAVIALPSGLNNAGTSFSDTWYGSS